MDEREKLPRIHSSVVRHLLAYNLRNSKLCVVYNTLIYYLCDWVGKSVNTIP